jgi:molecular chaperone HtpG
MTVAEENRSESRPFEADVAKLLQLIVHSVYSEKSVFLRELISNAADACERLRYEAIAEPALLGDDPKPRRSRNFAPRAACVYQQSGDNSGLAGLAAAITTRRATQLLDPEIPAQAVFAQ